MKLKPFFLSILFLCLASSFFTSCEAPNINEEIENFENDKRNVQAINRDEVEDPGSRGN